MLYLRLSGYVLAFIMVAVAPALAQPTGTPADILALAGGPGNQRFYAIHELSDGTVLVAGTAPDLDWLPADAPRTQLAITSGSIINTSGTGVVGFLLHLSGNLSTVLHVAHLAPGAAEDVRYIRTNTPAGSPTGGLYISGTNKASGRDDGYYVGRLNANFIASPPTALDWVFVAWATGDHKEFQPWDVDGLGRVVYVRGEPNTTNWCELRRFDPALGRDAPVPGFRQHFIGPTARDWQGLFADAPEPVQFSSLVLKPRNRGSLRSWTTAEHESWQSDGNGGWRRGRWPADMFFAGAFDPSDTSANQTMPGYTGYRLADNANTTARVGAVVANKRTNAFYLGFSFKSVLPGGNPDFEPTVMALDADGNLMWWNRLWREYTGQPGQGTANTSSPDQYVDGLTLDMSRPPGQERLAVLARSHGNNVVNFWSGNGIVHPQNPGSSFHNGFTGTSGNIHISWVGIFEAATGDIRYASWNAEYVDGSTNYGAPYADPILDGWPSHNTGWPNLNTTRLRPTCHFDALGRLYVLARAGRRTLTTANAYQKMPKPGQGSSTWNHYVRVFAPDLTTLAYSSVLTGAWDLSTGAGGDNVEIHGIFPTQNGILVAGFHRADASGTPTGNTIPTRNPLPWGTTQRQGETPVLGRLLFSAPTPLAGLRVY